MQILSVASKGQHHRNSLFSAVPSCCSQQSLQSLPCVVSFQCSLQSPMLHLYLGYFTSSLLALARTAVSERRRDPAEGYLKVSTSSLSSSGDRSCGWPSSSCILLWHWYWIPELQKSLSQGMLSKIKQTKLEVGWGGLPFNVIHVERSRIQSFVIVEERMSNWRKH